MNIGRKEEFDVLSLDVTMPGFARMDWRRLRLTVQFAPGPYGHDQSTPSRWTMRAWCLCIRSELEKGTLSWTRTTH